MSFHKIHSKLINKKIYLPQNAVQTITIPLKNSLKPNGKETNNMKEKKIYISKTKN